jgi:hypothetical protein
MSGKASVRAQPATGSDHLTPARALILQAYYALRGHTPAAQIGSHEIRVAIREFIRLHRLSREVPCASLVRMTLLEAGVPHRPTGRPRKESRTRDPQGPPLLPIRRQAPRIG